MGSHEAHSEWGPGPAEPTIAAAEVHLWLARLDGDGRSAESALRAVLARYLGADPEEIELRREEGGKPRLAQSPEPLRFNLSHSGELALVAVAAAEVGVDVERVDPRRRHLRIAERRLPPAAAAAVRDASEAERAAVFTAEWARFEARQKCLGVGVFDVAPPNAAVTVASVPTLPGYAAAVAIEGASVPRVRRFLMSTLFGRTEQSRHSPTR